jgi:hypothetical protein
MNRKFLNTAALAAGGMMMVGSQSCSKHRTGNAPAGAQGATPPTPKHAYKMRPAKVEILFKAPGLSGNGMQCTEEGIWTIDIAGSRGETPGRCKVYLSSYEGKKLREISPEGTGPSGVGVDEDNRTIWIGSTYSREIIRADAKTGETIEKHFTPGAGVIYRRTTDIAARPDTYGAKARTEAGFPRAGSRWRRCAAVVAAGEPGQNSGQGTSDGLGVGRGGAIAEILDLRPGHRSARTADAEREAADGGASGTDDLSHGPEDVDRRAHVSNRRVPSTQHRHRESRRKTSVGIGHEHGRFFKRDMVTGEIVDAIVLRTDAAPHGMSVYQGYIYWVDDIGNGIAPFAAAKDLRLPRTGKTEGQKVRRAGEFFHKNCF